MRRLLSRKPIRFVLFLPVALLALNLAGCSESGPGGELKENLPPTVWLSSAPPEGTTSTYTIHLYWGGWDPDGEISHYEYAITNNIGMNFSPADTVDAWHPVMANDSLFTFSADLLADSNSTTLVSEFVRSHTFFIRAVDRQGARSIEPAYRSFTARTLSPEVNIQVPRQTGLNPALVPPITTFRWTAKDYVDNLTNVQDPEEVQYLIFPAPDGYQNAINRLRSDPAAEEKWGPWVSYDAPGDSGRFWTSPPMEEGSYLFAIRARDEAGAVTPVLDESRNLRRLRVSQRSSGPILTVTNEFLGSVTTSVCNTPVVIMDLPAGVPVGFCWSADAEAYGGLVSGYRYGWDIADLDDPDQWETDYTPFTSDRACTPQPRTYFFGSHVFTIEVVDNSGFCSRIEVKINIVEFTFNKSIAVIDDYSPDENPSAGWQGSGKGIVPSDSEHDEFWNSMLGNVFGFDPSADVFEVDTGSEIALTDIAIYKTLVWSVFSDKNSTHIENLPLLYQFIQYREKNPSQGSATGKRQPNLLALFMAAGGRVLITGQHPVSNVLNRSFTSGVKYPFITLYEVEGSQEGTPAIDLRLGDQSFGYKDLCVDVLDYSNLPSNQRRNGNLNCPIGSLRGVEENYLRDHTMREAYPLDLSFPTLQLRPEASAMGKAYYEKSRGVDAEIYNPQYFYEECRWTPSQSRDCFEPVYGLECFDTGEPIYHQPIAFWTSTYANRVPEGIDDVPPARSIVFGFPLVFFEPEQVRPALEQVFFEEWGLLKQFGE